MDANSFSEDVRPAGRHKVSPPGRPAPAGRLMSCSVVICAHTMDRWADICDAVRSVQTQDAPAEQIILVIDQNRELFERCKSDLSGIEVIENHEAKGLSGARNSGVAASNADIVAFLDDDAVAKPGWLKAMVRSFEDPFVLGVGAVATPRWLGVRPRWFPDEFLWIVGCAFRGIDTEAVRNGLGCAMGMRRSIFARVGGFDIRLGRTGSGLPISCEETEFSLRAARAVPGAKFVYAPGAVVEHKVPVERLTFRYYVLRCFAEGVSKARVARLSGAESLATERTYVLRTLLRAVARGLADSAFRLDAWAGARAIAIVAGLASTVAGYGWERFGLFARGERRLRADLATAGRGMQLFKRWNRTNS